MNNDLVVRFRIKYKSSRSQESVQKNVSSDELITMRVSYNSMRMEFSTGYHIDPLRWDDEGQCVTGPSRDGTSASEINLGLMRFKRMAYEIEMLFQERELIPTQADFKKHFMMLRYSEPEIDIPQPVKTVRTVRKSKKNY